jgi:HSP20 family protein
VVGTQRPRWSDVLPRQLESVQREMDQMFEHFFGGGTHTGAWFAPATLWEEEGCWRLEVDLPGVRQEDIDITLEKNALRLKAERKPPLPDGKYWHQERSYGTIERTITLPETVDAEQIEAELKEGVLRLRLAKRPEFQPKKVQVKGA